MDGRAFLAAYDDVSPDANRAFGAAYCRQRGFAAVGTMRRGELPPQLAAFAATLQAYLPSSGGVCAHPACPLVAVIECLPAGAPACPVDSRGNVG